MRPALVLFMMATATVVFAAPKVPPPETPDLATIVGRDPAVFPVELSKVELGMTLDEVRKAAPRAFGRERVELKDGRASLNPRIGNTDVWLQLDFADGRLYSVVFMVHRPHADVLSGLTAVWGEPERMRRYDQPEHVWMNTKLGLRARLEAPGRWSTISYQRLVTLDAMIGTTKGRLGIERIPLLGATRAEVVKAYERLPVGHNPNQLTIHLPTIDDGPLDDSAYGALEVMLSKDRVIKYMLVLRVRSKNVADRVRMQLGALFGASKEIGAPFPGQWTFVGPPEMNFSYDADTNILSINVDWKKGL